MKNHTAADQASVSNVRQSRQKARGSKPKKSVKVSARLTPEIAAANPSGKNWGRFFTRLTQKKTGLYDEEIAHHTGWCVVHLDRLSSEVPARFPDDSSRPLSHRIDRLRALSRFTEEIAALRAVMEELYHAY
jgi:hypothetical protein